MQQELNPYSELKAATNVSVFDMDAIPKKKNSDYGAAEYPRGEPGKLPAGEAEMRPEEWTRRQLGCKARPRRQLGWAAATSPGWDDGSWMQKSWGRKKNATKKTAMQKTLAGSQN